MSPETIVDDENNKPFPSPPYDGSVVIYKYIQKGDHEYETIYYRKMYIKLIKIPEANYYKLKASISEG